MRELPDELLFVALRLIVQLFQQALNIPCPPLDSGRGNTTVSGEKLNRSTFQLHRNQTPPYLR
jgi:hypothetical protein